MAERESAKLHSNHINGSPLTHYLFLYISLFKTLRLFGAQL